MSRAEGQRNINFAQLLAGLLFLVLLASMSLIAVVSSYFTRQSVEELSDSIVEQTLARVELRIGALLDQAMNQNAQGKMLMDGSQLPMGDFKALGAYFSHSLLVLTDLSNLGLGIESNGDYLFAERLIDGTIRIREYVEDETGTRVIRNWRWHGAERELIEVQPWDGYDPRKRPWYQRAVEVDKDTWTETYRFWYANERGAIPGITFASPMRDASGKFLGVLDSDIDLEDMCDFLAAVREDMMGYAFVVERRLDGSLRLIAHPDPKVLPEPEKSGVEILSDRAANSFVNTVLSDETKRTSLAGGGNTIFNSDGKKYFGSARELTRPGQPPWIVAVIIPVDDVLGGVYRNDRRALWIGLICLAATALLAVRLARRIGKPLRELTREAQAIRRLDLNGKADVASRIEEVTDLANSMSEMKSSLRSFQKFVPVDIVREIVSTAIEARLGGRRATLTVLFSDIADFTPTAERMSPEALVEQLGEYLGQMSEVILSAGGTVDKFIGDGIMAFWGAPRDNPQHAVLACRAALEHQHVLAKLRDRWRADGRPELYARIGLNTGSAVVGNIGSESRLNYTAMGDTVNLASRIEGLNKFYGTGILLSAACVESAGSAIIARPVDLVAVKGREEGVVVYELLSMAGEESQTHRELLRLTSEAFAAYSRGDFDVAIAVYASVLSLRTDDPVALAMQKRAREHADSSQSAGRAIVARMDEK